MSCFFTTGEKILTTTSSFTESILLFMQIPADLLGHAAAIYGNLAPSAGGYLRVHSHSAPWRAPCVKTLIYFTATRK